MPALSIRRDGLRAGAVERSGIVEFGADWGPPGFDLAAPPRADLRAEESEDGGIRLTGTLRARLVVTCSRCLEEGEREVEVPIDLTFEPGLDPWDEEPGLYRLDYRSDAQGEELQVASALREELVLSLPDYPVCRDDCRGLCPKCGTNWNVEECECEEETGDPRWDALRRQLASDSAGPDEDNKDG